ncbi:putative CONSERVED TRANSMEMBRANE domain protein [Mycobacterium xenopi 4042]|uniref:Putative CONSERVED TRANSMEMBRANE domain protein n=1 Tax=Mycobacterium xenopi 4042 TaxID=1299334 RepID=X8CKA9_MYCXE|nr:putative CONSERVED TRANSMEMBRANE domain protein [Mycobacterium xenopi 3993]EUA56787.1 putative CONSERVED TRANSMEMBRANE domain protein [Mycobacterium xenopi 4042]
MCRDPGVLPLRHPLERSRSATGLVSTLPWNAARAGASR